MTGRTVLAIAVVALLVGASTLTAADEKPLVLAYYYTWYSTGFGPHAQWSSWNTTTPSEIYTKGCDPETIVFPPGIRQISSCAYPLIGPYDSDNIEVVRWHMRLAQAAGLDGFLVDWWGMAHWQKTPGLTRLAFEKAVMPAAEAEDFKVCFFDETPQFYENLDEAITWAIQFLEKYKESPAYLKIDGKPVYCIYQVWSGKLKPDEGRRFIREVEAKVGPVYWVFDRIVATGDRGEGLPRLKVAPGWDAVDEIDAICAYSTFSSVRISERKQLTRLFTQVARDVHRRGKKIWLPVHPGMDNRKIQTDEVAKKQGKPHWGIPRRAGQTLKDYLAACVAARADVITITSFNEWPETTVIEPAMTWPDPYLYLKILAEFKGVTFKPPPLPRRSVLDPAIVPMLEKYRPAP